jgi:hypothetical protein
VALTSTQVEENDLTSLGIFTPLAQVGFQDNGMSMTFDPPIPIHEGAIVGMHYTQTSTATVSGGWLGVLEDV